MSKKRGQLSKSLDTLFSWIKDKGVEKNIEIRTIKESNQQEIFEANYTAFKESLMERLLIVLEDKKCSMVRHKLINKDDEKYLKALFNDKSFTSMYNIKKNADGSFDISMRSVFEKTGIKEEEQNPNYLLKESLKN